MYKYPKKLRELPANIDDKFHCYYLLDEEKYLIEKYFVGNVLDLCCGTGRTTLILHEKGYKVKGYEKNHEFVRIANKRFPYLDISQGNIEKLPEKGKFNNIICGYNSLGYTNLEKSIAEIERLLNPGGIILFSALNIRWFLLGSLIYTFKWRPFIGIKEHHVMPDRFANTIFATEKWWEKKLKNFELLETIKQNPITFLSSRIHYVFRGKNDTVN